MSLPFLPKLIASLSIFACSSAFAVTQFLPTDNIFSVGQFGADGNTVKLGQIPANATFTAISYDVDLTAFPESTLSDIRVAITNTNLDGVIIIPAVGVMESGRGHFQGFVDLSVIDPDTMLNSEFTIGADGLLRFEFFQGDEDVTGAGGLWNSGRISFEYSLADVPGDPGVPAGVPEPATGTLMAAGLGIMVYAGRRRNASRASRTTPTLH